MSEEHKLTHVEIAACIVEAEAQVAASRAKSRLMQEHQDKVDAAFRRANCTIQAITAEMVARLFEPITSLREDSK